MAKSIRSKIKKRLRTAKRQRVDAMIVTPQLKEHHEALTRVAQGRTIETRKPKNAFKYPKAQDAVFPQHEIMKPIDFRAQNLPMAGYVFRGNRRKYDAEQSEYMNQVATAMHPKTERLAGGGAVLAATGQKVSVKDAELIAAAVQIGGSEQLSAASAVAAAVSQASASAAPMEEAGEPEAPAVPEPTPEGAADTSRRPVLKDARRQQRAAEHRPRPNSIKKKGKRSAAEANEAYAAAAAPKPKAEAAAAPAKPAASDGDAEMKPASGGAPVKKVKKKGKAKAA